MRKYFLFLLVILGLLPLSVFGQNRTVVNTETVNRKVITISADPSNQNVDVMEQLEKENREAEAAKAKQRRIAEIQKAAQERMAAEKKAEQERLAAEQKAEQERMAAEKKAEQERLAAEQKAEQERMAAEKKAEQERMAEQKRLIARQKQDSIRNDRKQRIAAYPWTNFILVNGSYALYNNWGVGITYGRVKQWGWYVNWTTNFNYRFSGDFNAYRYYANYEIFYSGKQQDTRMTVTIGTLVRMRIPLYAYFGAGYGFHGVYNELVDGKWISVQTASTTTGHGVNCELGLMGNIKGFGISAGVSNTFGFNGGRCWDIKIGLGYCF